MRRLFSQRDAHRWAWDRVLPCLLPADASRLAVAALESRCHEFAALAQWLLHGDAPFPRLDVDAALLDAARAGCWTATAFFLRTAVASDASSSQEEPSGDVSPIERVIALHKKTRHRFPVDVIEAAAARGEFLAVQWLLGATDTGDDDDGDDNQAAQAFLFARRPIDLKQVAIEAAARAGQLEMVDWLVAYSPDMRCIVPYDKTLGILSWSRETHLVDQGIQYSTAYCATAAYGYQAGEGRSTASFLDARVPLGGLFAHHGDLEMLQQLDHLEATNPELPELIPPSAMERAAAGGHLEVVQWLYKRAPSDLDGVVVMVAAEHGHLHVLEWAWDVINLTVLPEQSITDAARNGHLHVLRWLTERYGAMDYNEPLQLAIKGGHLPVVQFLHEECDVAITTEVESVLPRCPNLATMAYVLDAWSGLPPRYSYLLTDCAVSASIDMIKYLVLERGCWSRNALLSARYRRDECLQVCQFLYAHARVRAERRGSSFHSELSLEGVTVLECLQMRNFETALWLIKAAPGVPLGTLRRNGGGHSAAKALVEEPGARAALLACVRYRASKCSRLAWFPEWAIRANCFEAFEALLDMQHPYVSPVKTYQDIIEWSRDRRFMLRMMKYASPAPCIGQVVTWAAQIGSVAVLEAVLPFLLEEKRAEKIHLVNALALERGYVDLLQWCSTQAYLDEARRAVRQGHVTVLEWLHERRLLPTGAKLVETLALEAATCDQLGCLRWLLETLNLRRDSIESIQRELVRRQHTNAARIAARYTHDSSPNKHKSAHTRRQTQQ